MGLHSVLHLAAIGCFVLAATGVLRGNWVAVGLAVWDASTYPF